MRTLKRSYIPTIIALSLTFIYWSYLAFHSQMNLVFDALGYQTWGTMFYKDGWVEYFRTGPNIEPFYSIIVSFSMRIADTFSVSYQMVQKLFQMAVLFVTQLLLIGFLRKSQVREGVVAAVVLFVGVSPALVNSVFSLFSEIVVCLIVLSILYVLVKSWRATLQGSFKSVLFFGFCMGILFMVAASIRASFIYISYFVLVPWLFVAFFSLIKGQRKTFVSAITFALLSVVMLISFVSFMKHLNKTHNGEYVYATRGTRMLYGTTEQRTIDEALNNFWPAVASIPGEGVCHKLFSSEECLYWTFRKADRFGHLKSLEVQGVNWPDQKLENYFMHLSKENVLYDPFRYMLFYFIEVPKMFFWETTQMGFVHYPKWLRNIYNYGIFKNGLRLGVAVLTFIAFVNVCMMLLRNFYEIFSVDPQSEKIHICFFSMLIILGLVGLYSFFYIVPRYLLPIAPLYILFIGYFISNVTCIIKRD